MVQRDKNALNIYEGDWEEGHKNFLNGSCKGLLLFPKAVKILLLFIYSYGEISILQIEFVYRYLFQNGL